MGGVGGAPDEAQAGMKFTADTFRFLEELAADNQRSWFDANRERYEAAVREPALALVRELGTQLAPLLPSFPADDRKVGGSLMRIHRDTRFSKDKTPYKTNIGIQLRHSAGRDVHAPGVYVHFATTESFVGIGLWEPEPPTLELIRQKIVSEAVALRALLDEPSFKRTWSVDDQPGESLKRPPKGYPPDHPMIELLKRKSHLATAPLTRADALADDLASRIVARLKVGVPYLAFLCSASGVSL
jgi:uncharacterized protein (TIGR02453 family)